jgi:hypothetical protein
MRLALDILEGQNFARKNHHRVGPRCAGASELPAVDALDRDRQFRWRFHPLPFYMGHKNIQHTLRYTEMAPDRFKDF